MKEAKPVLATDASVPLLPASPLFAREESDKHVRRRANESDDWKAGQRRQHYHSGRGKQEAKKPRTGEAGDREEDERHVTVDGCVCAFVGRFPCCGAATGLAGSITRLWTAPKTTPHTR